MLETYLDQYDSSVSTLTRAAVDELKESLEKRCLVQEASRGGPLIQRVGLSDESKYDYVQNRTMAVYRDVVEVSLPWEVVYFWRAVEVDFSDSGFRPRAKQCRARKRTQRGTPGRNAGKRRQETPPRSVGLQINSKSPR